MLRKFQAQIALSQEDSFSVLIKSGAEILSWKVSRSEPQNGYIEWKQSIWSLTGTAVISARLEQKEEKNTLVTVEIYKPFQICDPVGICNKIYNKLQKISQKNVKLFQAQEDE